MKMRYVCLCGAALALCSGQTVTPEAAAVLARYESALGGGKPLPELRSIILLGEGEYKGINQHAGATIEIRSPAPNDYRASMQVPFGRIERVVSGGSGYGIHPQTGKRALSSFELVEIRRERALYQPHWWRDMYTRIESAPPETVDGQPLDILVAATAEGRKERLGFDRKTHLPAYLELWEEGPEGVRAGEPLLVKFKLSDYRSAGSLQVPFVVRRIRPNSEFVYRFKEVEVNGVRAASDVR